MTAENSYATLQEFKDYIRSRGGSVQDDTTDDAVISDFLEAASRYLDSETGRAFYPSIATTYYTTPEDRELYFDFDVLEVLSLTNGDGSNIASSNWNLIPKNYAPKFALRLKETSTIQWLFDTSNNSEFVISLTSINGYGGKWEAVTTLAEDLDANETAFDLTSAARFLSGHVVRIGNEITIVDSKAANTVTVIRRGDDGSTAATALTGATVHIWRPLKDCHNACIELTNSMYRRRFGQSSGSANEQVTAAGIVISPRDVPVMVKEFIATYRRYV